MRRWRESFFNGLCLIGIPMLARSEPQAALPQDFLTTFQAVNAAYERKDIEGALSHYTSNCTFIVVTPEFHLEYKDAEHKSVKSNIKATRQRHNVNWQRQELQRLFFVTRQPFEKMYSLPLQNISVTSDIQQSSINRNATELHLTVERKIHSHQGQVQGILNEVDEEVWSKGAQGWKLKCRTINQKGGWTDFS
jgi:hypothetical protein